MKNVLEKFELVDFIIDRAKSQQAIGTHIDRMANVFRKNGRSEGIRDLER